MKIDKKDLEQFVEQMVNTAMTTAHSEQTLLRNTTELRAAKYVSKSLKKMNRMFEELKSGLEDEYTKRLKSEIEEISISMAIRKLADSIAFYEYEQSLLEHSIAEYITYMYSGHLFRSLLGYQRPEKDLKDYIFTDAELTM